ncbi:hypothetical protein BGX38DRAFT_1268832 [Terfezia claveryi]|nr:hypothetical protein BGX38DRAFT_1268832 [Terfezia claveryi]
MDLEKEEAFLDAFLKAYGLPSPGDRTNRVPSRSSTSMIYKGVSVCDLALVEQPIDTEPVCYRDHYLYYYIQYSSLKGICGARAQEREGKEHEWTTRVKRLKLKMVQRRRGYRGGRAKRVLYARGGVMQPDEAIAAEAPEVVEQPENTKGRLHIVKADEPG